ncbi:MAG: phosphoribosyltransferase [Waddliaceae bacterium]
MFQNREEAGKELAHALINYRDHQDALVIGLPRGGVPVAYQIASFLNLPLDVICPRKIGAPGNPEYAIGAVTETGEKIISQSVVDSLGVSEKDVKRMIQVESEEALRRLKRYREGLPKRDLKDKVVILVDDGIATGSTIKAAIYSIQAESAKKIIVAVPVSPINTYQEIQEMVDEIYSLDLPLDFYAVGQFYQDFGSTSDQEVYDLLHKI